jgi:hypothetical protein
MRSLPRWFEPLVLLGLFAVTACGEQRANTPSPDTSLPGGALRVVHLPTAPAGESRVCLGVGLVTVLHGSIFDPQAVWLESMDGKQRIEAEWPPGYTAWFTPGLEVRDEDGDTVLRDGDLVDGSCGHDGGTERLAPPFTGYGVECGPLEPLPCVLLARRVADKVGWPGRDIAVIALGDNRSFSVTFEDGTSTRGVAPVVR